MESVVDKELDLYVLNSESDSNRILEEIDTENNLVKNLDSSNVERILDKDLEVINTESSSDFFSAGADSFSVKCQQCIFCKSSNHLSSLCNLATISQIKRLARANDLCFLCLS